MLSTLRQNIGSLALGLLCASMLISPRAIAANSKSPAIFPPNSHAHGQSMGEWLLDYTRWKGDGYPGSGQFGKVRFIPQSFDDAPAGTGTPEDPLISETHESITIRAGTAIFDVPVAWYGEYYPDGSVDPFVPDEFWGSFITVHLKLNGKTITDQAEDYYISPLMLNPPIPYSEPTEWGSLGNAYVQGVALMLKPLPPGVHTYEAYVSILVPGTDDMPGTGIISRSTITVTVVP